MSNKFHRLISYLVLFGLVCAILLIGYSSSSVAASWPDKNMTFNLVAGYSPGGGTDAICRIVAPFLEKYLGIPVVVQNIPGAGGLVGHNSVYAGKNDGYSAIYTATTDGIWSYINLAPSGVPWKLEDWKSTGVICSMMAQGMLCLKEQPWQDFADFIKDAQSKPAKTYTLGTTGPNRIEDVWIIEMMEVFNVEFNWVFYDSSASIQTDLLAGDLDVAIFANARPDMVNHPNFRVLTGMTIKYPEGCPYVGVFPTLIDFEEELNFSLDQMPAMSMTPVVTYLVKENIPDEAYEVLCQAFKSVAEDPEYQEAIKVNSWPTYISPEDAAPIFEGISRGFAAYKDRVAAYVRQ